MKRSAWFLVAVAALAACGGKDQPAGNAAVYARINALSDCRGLQTEFDQASRNFDAASKGTDASKWAIGYMQAAESRMKKLNC